MGSLSELKEMIGKLVDFDMNLGVTPIELASNIYEDDYNEVRIMKKFGLVECSVFFYDKAYFSDKKLKYEYCYYYDSNNVLQKILQIQNKKAILLWSREDERNQLIRNILDVAHGLNVDIKKLSLEDDSLSILLKTVDL